MIGENIGNEGKGKGEKKEKKLRKSNEKLEDWMEEDMRNIRHEGMEEWSRKKYILENWREKKDICDGAKHYNENESNLRECKDTDWWSHTYTRPRGALVPVDLRDG